ncbi:MAG: rhodanese-like domain-containing protein [Candidatus Zixiibacteriota bacterium]
MTTPGGTGQVAQEGCVDVARLAQLMLEDRDIMLVDVRRTEEWMSLRAPQTKVFVPYDELTHRHAELAADPGTPIYLICRSGRRSAIGAETLSKLGYRRVYNVSGGMKAWVAAGLPVETGPPRSAMAEG